MALASLRDVRFTYAYAEESALKGMTLDLELGKLHGVVGLNSSGKTTLCSLLRGIIPHFHEGELSGEVEILDKSLLDWDPAELSSAVGCVFDNPFTQISGIRTTVYEEIALGLENLGIEHAEMVDRVERVVHQLGLTALIEKNPNELSGGQKQKVAFAAIIAMDADVMVIDEPTSQLDPESSEEVFQIIANLKNRGKSIVLVEHKIDLLAQFADTITVLHNGTVALHGPTREILGSPELDTFGVSAPEVTEFARRLADAGRPLPDTPITRVEATEAVAKRIDEVRHAH